MFVFYSKKNSVIVYLWCALGFEWIAIDMVILCLTKRTWMFSMFLFLFHFLSAIRQSLSNQIVSHVKNSGKMTKFKIETNDPVCVRLTFPNTHTHAHANRIKYSNSKYSVYYTCDKMEKRILALYISLHIFPFIIIYGCCFGAYLRRIVLRIAEHYSVLTILFFCIFYISIFFALSFSCCLIWVPWFFFSVVNLCWSPLFCGNECD